MTKLSKNSALAPSKACKGLKKTKNAKARPAAKKAYRACVKAGNRLNHDLTKSAR